MVIDSFKNALQPNNKIPFKNNFDNFIEPILEGATGDPIFFIFIMLNILDSFELLSNVCKEFLKVSARLLGAPFLK